MLDGGNPSSAPDVPQDIAFKLHGTIASSNNASKFADDDGDGKADPAVFRKTGLAAANPASFWIRQSDGSYTVIPWGNGLDTALSSIRVY